MTTTTANRLPGKPSATAAVAKTTTKPALLLTTAHRRGPAAARQPTATTRHLLELLDAGPKKKASRKQPKPKKRAAAATTAATNKQQQQPQRTVPTAAKTTTKPPPKSKLGTSNPSTTTTTTNTTQANTAAGKGGGGGGGGGGLVLGLSKFYHSKKKTTSVARSTSGTVRSTTTRAASTILLDKGTTTTTTATASACSAGCSGGERKRKDAPSSSLSLPRLGGEEHKQAPTKKGRTNDIIRTTTGDRPSSSSSTVLAAANPAAAPRAQDGNQNCTAGTSNPQFTTAAAVGANMKGDTFGEDSCSAVREDLVTAAAAAAAASAEMETPETPTIIPLSTSLLLPKRNHLNSRRPRIATRQTSIGSKTCTSTNTSTTNSMLCVAQRGEDDDDDMVLPLPKSGNNAADKANQQSSSTTICGAPSSTTASLLAPPPSAAASSFTGTSTNATSTNAAWKPIPRPSEFADAVGGGEDAAASTKPAAATAKSKRRGGGKGNGSGNFVRLNLRNKAGSCRNTTHRGASSKSARRWEERQKERQAQWEERNGSSSTNRLFATASAAPLAVGVDPVDDYVDGLFHPKSTTAKSKKKGSNHHKSGKTIPLCTGHQQPCKLLTVKKTGPNKGRQFFACACPRVEQCNHFQWADDTARAAQEALLRNRSGSGFIARQVAAHAGRIRCLTVPELRDLARRHRLDGSGKKAQLLVRLSIWVRDEVAAACGMGGDDDDDDQERNNADDQKRDDAEKLESIKVDKGENEDEVSSNSSDEEEDEDDDFESSSDEELELIGDKPEKMLRLSVNMEESDAKKEKSKVNLHGRTRRTMTMPDDEEDVSSPSGDEDDESEIENRTTRPAAAAKRSKPESPMHATLRQLFGHSNFRDGQEWAIDRCLNQKRSLLVAPTGFGKSLCFTLPAAMMDGVCIVVSPLLSLIQDQIRLLPARLPAVTLSGPMSTASMATTLDDIVRGRIKVLFVSPERLTSSSFRRLFRQRWNQKTNNYERMFPQVSLFCVDEAHCLSQWAHNFRPSYLRLRSMMDMIQPQSVLAITATAGPRVVCDICRTLQIDSNSLSRDPSSVGTKGKGNDTASEGVRISKTDRDNIDVSCLFLDTQEQRISKLLKILSRKAKTTDRAKKSDLLDGCLESGSVIVYVWRQRDAEVVAENIQAAGISGGVVVYHGGMDSTARAKAQSRFMRGKVRICVATIAFGLGIDKADVEGVVHLYLSSSPEHYLQEIGRAGRAGRPARAVALVLKEEAFIRHSLAHTDYISESQVRALLSFLHRQVEDSVASLPPERSSAQPVNISLPLAMSVLGCDCKTETAETIVSLLEEREGKEPLLFVEGVSYDSATIAPKRCSLKKLAEREPVARAILHCAECVEPPAGETLRMEKGSIEIQLGSDELRESRLVGQTYGSFAFSVAQASNCLGESAEPRHVFAALRRLQTNGDIDFVLAAAPKDRALNIRLTNAGMELFKPGNQSLVDDLITATLDRFTASIYSCASKVLDINHMMRRVSEVDPDAMDTQNPKKSARLAQFQELIASYFEAEGNGMALVTETDDLPAFSNDFTNRELSADCQVILSHLHDMQRAVENGTIRLLLLGDSSVTDYTALTITKFLHGIAPASLPVALLRQHHLFGKLQRAQFGVLLETVTALFDPKDKE